MMTSPANTGLGATPAGGRANERTRSSTKRWALFPTAARGRQWHRQSRCAHGRVPLLCVGLRSTRRTLRAVGLYTPWRKSCLRYTLTAIVWEPAVHLVRSTYG